MLARLAPGTALREGLERILRGRTGALIVLGDTDAVDALSDGGFELDVEFSPTRLRELCKMDGAVVLSEDASRLVRANVQLMPDASIPTVESGTRHRTAERVAVQTSMPVISVSHSMSTISLYFGGRRHEVNNTATILARANQALATLERYRKRLDEVAHTLSSLEIEDFTTLRDAMTVVQRLLMVRRIADELAGHLIELGTDGRLLGLQVDELLAGVPGMSELLIRDYLPEDDPQQATRVLAELDRLTGPALLDLSTIARTMGHNGSSPDSQVSSRGYRLLAGLQRLPAAVLERMIAHFGSLQTLLAATAADLQEVEGIGEARARVVREGMSRLAESAINERAIGGSGPY